MAIKAHLDQPAFGDSQRSATDSALRSTPRRALRLEASGFAPGWGEANVTIHNISAAGLLLETGLDLNEGEQLALDLPEAGAVTAVIVWRSERLYGCAFEQTLGLAALAAAQLRGLAPEPAAIRPAHALSASETLGARINRLRREASLTLADVAAALGVSKPTVWAWEKGKARPLPERLGAIAAALGVMPEALAETQAPGVAIGALIDNCRQQIAQAYGTAPETVRIYIEL
jgi:transcriptional regulator with XRE-family HTH domain